METAWNWAVLFCNFPGWIEENREITQNSWYSGRDSKHDLTKHKAKAMPVLPRLWAGVLWRKMFVEQVDCMNPWSYFKDGREPQPKPLSGILNFTDTHRGHHVTQAAHKLIIHGGCVGVQLVSSSPSSTVIAIGRGNL
jgi:hypothetical protein